MNIKINALSIVGIALALLVTTSMATPLAFGQTNQTDMIEEKVKAASEKNAMKAAAPNDEIYVLICPEGWETLDQCQVYFGQPIQ
jgi:hypothetical protein